MHSQCYIANQALHNNAFTCSSDDCSIIYFTIVLGEACGQGSLIELENRVVSQRFKYSCYNIYGDLNDPNQKNYIIDCATKIITATKKGKLFFDNFQDY